MATTIHQVIMRPEDTVRFICDDGLSAISKSNIELLFNFGTDIKFIDCGPGFILASLSLAEESMKSKFKEFAHMKKTPATRNYNCDIYHENSLERDFCMAYN